MFLIMMIAFCALAVIGLGLGFLGIFKLARSGQIAVRDTVDEPFAHTPGSGFETESQKASQFHAEKTWNKTRGKEAEVSFSLSYPQIRRGLKDRDPGIVSKFLTASGFITFVVSFLMTIGFLMLWKGSERGWIFVAFPALFYLVFWLLVFFGKEPKAVSPSGD